MPGSMSHLPAIHSQCTGQNQLSIKSPGAGSPATGRGRPSARGAIITVPSHQELAAHVGTVRELVSRTLTRLQAQGFIAVEARAITTLDCQGLEADLAASE